MKVVLDTNVLLSALGTHGLCQALLEACLVSHEVVLSPPILQEVREHLRGKFKMPAAEVAHVITFLRTQCTLVAPAETQATACRDPDDLMVLGTAVAGRADAIVSGDHDLLTLKSHQGIPILSPRAFYDRLRQ